ncbi:MAG: Txe/YoeB family addiction module toxin [Oscillospiraceae bacterium]
MYVVKFTSQSLEDFKKLKNCNLSPNAKNLVNILKSNPFANPPPYEKLCGDLKSFYSRRINYKHRLVYYVDEQKQEVIIVSMWNE